LSELGFTGLVDEWIGHSFLQEPGFSDRLIALMES